MDVNATMALLATNLGAAIAPIAVTREATDFANRTLAARRAGVVTLVADRVDDLKAPQDLADHVGKLKIYALYEFERAENVTGLTIEQAESAFLQQLITFCSGPGAGLCSLDVLFAQFSQQRDRPQGWLFAQLEFAELEV